MYVLWAFLAFSIICCKSLASDVNSTLSFCEHPHIGMHLIYPPGDFLVPLGFTDLDPAFRVRSRQASQPIILPQELHLPQELPDGATPRPTVQQPPDRGSGLEPATSLAHHDCQTGTFGFTSPPPDPVLSQQHTFDPRIRWPASIAHTTQRILTDLGPAANGKCNASDRPVLSQAAEASACYWSTFECRWLEAAYERAMNVLQEAEAGVSPTQQPFADVVGFARAIVGVEAMTRRVIDSCRMRSPMCLVYCVVLVGSLDDLNSAVAKAIRTIGGE